MSEDPTPNQSPLKAKKSPFKTRFESLGYFFGQPLESFEKLLQSETTSPSTSSPTSKIKPTDQDIIRHWIYLEDRNRSSLSHSDSVIGAVTDNLIDFYTQHHPFVDLR